MSSSGLVYAVIVGAWAVYLVPIWLRREEELNATRETERFRAAIKVLGNRAAAERHAAARVDGTTHGNADTESSARESAAARAAGSRGRLLARRRRVVGTLLALSLAGIIATAALGAGYLWLTGVPGLLFVAYAVHVRHDERERRRRQRRLAEQRRRRAVEVSAAALEVAERQRPTEPVLPQRQTAAPNSRRRSAPASAAMRPTAAAQEHYERPRAVGE